MSILSGRLWGGASAQRAGLPPGTCRAEARHAGL